MSDGVLRDLDGNALGFIRRHDSHDIKFWTCRPRVYLLSQPTFDHWQLRRYLQEIHLFDESRCDELYENGRNQFTGEPAENLFESAARGCYLSYGAGRNHRDHVTHVRTVKHGSVFEHGMISVKVACVGRGFTHELVRHRVGVAYSQVSTRYVDPYHLGFVIPHLIRKTDSPAAHEMFVDGCLNSLTRYEYQRECIESDLEFRRIPGATRRRKMARGSARANLPIGLAQVIQVSMNLRTARHIMTMRGSEGAEEEVRQFAEELVPVAKSVWPVALEDVELTDPGVHLEDGNF